MRSRFSRNGRFGKRSKGFNRAPSSSDGGGGGGAAGRALVFSGYAFPSFLSNIEYFDISSFVASAEFGTLTQPRRRHASMSSSTRALCCGGENNGFSRTNDVQYVEIATLSNSFTFGDLSGVRESLGALANETRGIVAGGSAPARSEIIEYFTIASTGNATDFGNLIEALISTQQSTSNQTIGLIAGGNGASGKPERINKITIATSANASDGGDLTLPKYDGAATSSNTKAVFVGGRNHTNAVVNTIERFIFASDSTASDIGDLASVNHTLGATSNGSKAVFCGGADGGGNSDFVSTIQSLEIESGTNSSEIGDLISARQNTSCASDAHGGL